MFSFHVSINTLRYHHQCGTTQASQTQHSMTANPDFETRAVHPLARFPTEIWLKIAGHTTRLNRRLLQMSSKSLYTILSPKHPKSLRSDDKITLRTIAENDWLHLPAHQICVMCSKYHLRQHVQPRSKPTASQKAHKELCPCTAGIRLAADSILCQCCWSQLLLRKGSCTLRGCFNEAWFHEWHVRERRDNFMLIVESTMSEDVSRFRHDAWWDSAGGDSRFSGVTWCGCGRLTLDGKLCAQIKYKLSRGLMPIIQPSHPLILPDPRTFARMNIGCLNCGSVYIISIKSQRQTQKVVVTRFLNLSSESVLAAHLDMPRAESRQLSGRLEPGRRRVIPGGRVMEHMQGKGRHHLMKSPDLLHYSDIGPYVYFNRKYLWLKANLYQAIERR